MSYSYSDTLIRIDRLPQADARAALQLLCSTNLDEVGEVLDRIEAFGR